MAAKAAPPDYSKWTFQALDDSGNPVIPTAAAAAPSPSQAVATTIQQDVQGAPKAQSAAPPAPPMPDMTAQDPHTFAVLTANQATSAMPNPMVEDFKKIYESALDKATDFRKTLQTQFAQQQSELQKAQILQQSAAQTDISKSAVIKAGEIAQEEEKAQRAEGITPNKPRRNGNQPVTKAKHH